MTLMTQEVPDSAWDTWYRRSRFPGDAQLQLGETVLPLFPSLKKEKNDETPKTSRLHGLVQPSVLSTAVCVQWAEAFRQLTLLSVTC